MTIFTKPKCFRYDAVRMLEMPRTQQQIDAAREKTYNLFVQRTRMRCMCVFIQFKLCGIVFLFQLQRRSFSANRLD